MKILLDGNDTVQAIQKMAREIWEHASHPEKIVLVGISTRGVPLAQKIAERIKAEKGTELPVGKLDITLYRDDLSRLAYHPIVKKTDIPVSIDSALVFLIDDVLYTGRTIRCALDALFDLGRPDIIGLAVLVDRGGREIPIQADVVGINYKAKENEVVHVRFAEVDGGEDKVEVATKE